MVTNNAINLSAAGLVRYDGAGTFTGVTVTQYAPLIGAASNGITSGTPGTNGQVFLGSTGTNPVFATLTGTGGITFTIGAGTLQINNTGGGNSWVTVTSSTQVMTSGVGYIANYAGKCVFSLPTSSAVGDVVKVTNINTAVGIEINYTTNQFINFGNQTSTVTSGSLTCTALGDSIELVCITTNLGWQELNSQGNWTIA